jgi:DNA-binding NarL/FixJ family response regulator
MTNLDLTSDVLQRLDTLIRLQAVSLLDRFSTQRERIQFLNRAGLPPKAIADILGTSPNSVSVALSKMKKVGGGGDEAKE